MKNDILNKIKKLMPLLVLSAIITALIYSIYYSSKLEEQIWERDRTIQELSFRSKLVEDYFDIKYNPADSTTSYILKDSIKNRFLTVKKEDVTNLDSIIKGFNSLVKEHNEIVDEHNSLVGKLNSLTNDKRNLEDVLGMIEKKYKITYDISEESKTIRISLKNTDMVDSAMVLLPFYRNKIERKPNGLWIVTH